MLLRSLPLALCTLVFALLHSSSASAASFPARYTLEHRLDSTSEWTTRGQVTLLNSTAGSFEQVQRASDLLGDVKQSDAEGRYLMRLVGGDGKGSQVVATKKCLITALIPGSWSHDVLTLVLPSHPSSTPLMSYSVVGLPPLNPSNGCPRQPIPRKGGSLINRDTQLKIQVEEQETAAEPVLRTPPRPRADGQVGGETPPPQKSFIQKYWFYIVPILVLLAMPSEPPASASGEGGGDAGSAGPGARRIR
ncbi:hypothetical protein BDZ90DRAFT_230644 [Jaminaea rosea]|uniref:ER membrane protein complex subunit 10 n=1 Tax=Jaminaea rosea TaxID=1569628 RepID=A0A316UWY0_9BASI|nr:hypothetical protein BDZ90DRAFT_230644 [Jaminaea rosea]PWN29799.1 hypothetical protein BDZ90DRAFT_230644 [Jaminaea rosea]